MTRHFATLFTMTIRYISQVKSLIGGLTTNTRAVIFNASHSVNNQARLLRRRPFLELFSSDEGSL